MCIAICIIYVYDDVDRYVNIFIDQYMYVQMDMKMIMILVIVYMYAYRYLYMYEPQNEK